MVHHLLHREALCKGEQDCGRVRPCWCDECGFRWDAIGEPPRCPRCNAGGRNDASWKHLQVDRCYECPLTALEEAMEGPRGQLIRRAMRLQNLMDAKVQISLRDFTVEEARVLELIATERPKGFTNGV